MVNTRPSVSLLCSGVIEMVDSLCTDVLVPVACFAAQGQRLGSMQVAWLCKLALAQHALLSLMLAAVLEISTSLGLKTTQCSMDQSMYCYKLEKSDLKYCVPR